VLLAHEIRTLARVHMVLSLFALYQKGLNFTEDALGMPDEARVRAFSLLPLLYDIVLADMDRISWCVLLSDPHIAVTGMPLKQLIAYPAQWR
jgi:hypothetical protein